ncbi:MAG: UDP-3-O-(3-hydroxymyristoyl)glucosamine N-acyltransferase [Verrucomicrobiota bacterium]|nr:UDP-3-O-(3-hydroxymyristoyl)glucosamine N-acyltransferase [Verrucomicrobiota bacterium]
MRSFTLEELARCTGAELVGDPSWRISGVEALDRAASLDASFLANSRYREMMVKSAAGVVCLSPEITPRVEGRNYLLSLDPSRTFQKIAELFITRGKSAFEGIHPTAVVHESVQLGNNVSIGPYAVIDRDVVIGEGSRIDSHVSIGYGVKIGSFCHLHPSSVVRERCLLGDRVILQPGAVIGSCGFGFLPDQNGHYQKLEQLGIVILEDDVEIGSNTTIDRARFKATIVRRGTKIDNLCQIAHNVEVGEGNMIAAQTGIAGSSKTGRFVLLGGQVGIVGHVELSDGVMVSSQSGVSKSLKKSGPYRGTPAVPLPEYHEREAKLRKWLKSLVVRQDAE